MVSTSENLTAESYPITGALIFRKGGIDILNTGLSQIRHFETCMAWHHNMLKRP